MTDKLSIESPEVDEDLEELRFSREQSYFDKSITIRFLIGIVFVLLLFVFLHFRQTYVESLELGSTAKNYVISQVDFSFPDDEATIILRQTAAQGIGTIYRISNEEILHTLREFQKFVSEDVRGMKKFEKIREEGDVVEFDAALNIVSTALHKSRFVEASTLKTIDQLPPDQLPIPKENFFAFFIPPKDAISSLPRQFWNQIKDELHKKDPLDGAVSSFFIDYFQPMSWQLEKDEGMEYSVRRAVMAQIPEKYTPVRSSERIVDKGEVITTRHLAILQAMKEELTRKRNLLDPMTIIGTFLMSLLFFSVITLYVRDNHKDVFFSNRKLALLATIVLLTLFLAKLVELFFLKSRIPLIEGKHFPLFVPFAAILLASLMNVRIAAFTSIFIAVVLALALAVESIPFLLINIIAALVALPPAKTIRRRKEVFIISAKAWAAAVVVIVAFYFYDTTNFSFSFVVELVTTFIFMTVTAILVIGFLPMFESIFKILTDITLMEFMDPSNELLRRLTIEAPGTYQHSILVGNLAEAAATAIGANGLFCRVSTLYHDIGKLANPQYFTENQLGGIDMHQLLTSMESAQVIIAHVSEGVLLARKNGLPEQFIDIIKEHHGTTLVYYFYHKEIEAHGGDKSAIVASDFRYSGPKPRTKESTIIMIADTLEAASRSLDLFNEHTVTELVESLVAQKMQDNQFDDSLLTFEELGVVKRIFIKTLLAASHTRIKYPPHHPGEEG